MAVLFNPGSLKNYDPNSIRDRNFKKFATADVLLRMVVAWKHLAVKVVTVYPKYLLQIAV